MINNDLISRSALLDSYDVRNVTEYDETGCGMNYKAVPVEAIEKAPAVDAEPVRHAKWVQKTDIMGNEIDVCSACEEEAVGYDGHMGDYITVPTDYCPHCGAKMDGDT